MALGSSKPLCKEATDEKEAMEDCGVGEGFQDVSFEKK